MVAQAWSDWIKKDAWFDGMTYRRVGPTLEDDLNPSLEQKAIFECIDTVLVVLCNGVRTSMAPQTFTRLNVTKRHSTYQRMILVSPVRKFIIGDCRRCCQK
jgi:hypothetical protein